MENDFLLEREHVKLGDEADLDNDPKHGANIIQKITTGEFLLIR